MLQSVQVVRWHVQVIVLCIVAQVICIPDRKPAFKLKRMRSDLYVKGREHLNRQQTFGAEFWKSCRRTSCCKQTNFGPEMP